MNLKNKLTKQEDQRQNHGYGKCFDGCQMEEGYRDVGEGVRGLINANR